MDVRPLSSSMFQGGHSSKISIWQMKCSLSQNVILTAAHLNLPQKLGWWSHRPQFSGKYLNAWVNSVEWPRYPWKSHTAMGKVSSRTAGKDVVSLLWSRCVLGWLCSRSRSSWHHMLLGCNISLGGIISKGGVLPVRSEEAGFIYFLSTTGRFLDRILIHEPSVADTIENWVTDRWALLLGNLHLANFLGSRRFSVVSVAFRSRTIVLDIWIRYTYACSMITIKQLNLCRVYSAAADTSNIDLSSC